MILRLLLLAFLLATTPAQAWLGPFGRGGGAVSGNSYTGACDTITGGCAAAYSTTHSAVAAYSGPMFELVQQAPVWTGTGYISGTTFTVSTTTTGSLPSSNVALSAPGSGTTPALTPITHIVSGSGPYTVDKSQTAGSSGFPLTMAAYDTLDVPQASHVANLSGVPAFCESSVCLVLIDFNEASTGSSKDLIASNISGGNTFAANCTASIVACAPLYWLDTNLNVAMVAASYPAGLETCAGMTTCSTSGLPTGGVSKSVMLNARPDMYTDCCGNFGLMEPCCTTVGGTMFTNFISGAGAVFGCTVSTDWCVGTDTEGVSYLASLPSGTASERNIYESRFVSGSNSLTSYVNNALNLTSTPATLTTDGQIRLGLAGDRSTTPIYFYDGLITADSGDHTAAYNNLNTWYSGLSPSALAGPLDVAFYVNEGAPDASNGYSAAQVGNARIGYSLRCLTASYTGPVADLTDSEGSPVTHTYGCINGVIDPAAATFCAANAPCRISGAYVQTPWSTADGNNSTLYDPLLKLACTGGLSTCPTATFNSLNGQPTMHFSGSQCLLSGSVGTSGTYSSRLLVPWEMGAVMRRTSGTAYAAAMQWDTTSHYFLGAGNAANTAAFANGQSFGQGTAADNNFHSVIADTTTGSTGTLYVDGVSVATSGANAGWQLTNFITVGCGWSGSAIINPLTGDIAEVWMQDRTSDAAGTLTSRVATIFANQEAFWGSL